MCNYTHCIVKIKSILNEQNVFKIISKIYISFNRHQTNFICSPSETGSFKFPRNIGRHY